MSAARSSTTKTPAFGPELFRFLRSLKANNNREWFLAHKAEFESDVRDPALGFIRSIDGDLRRISRHLVADARPNGGSLSRIYRDLRFSKDKRPYNTSIGLHFAHTGAEGRHGGSPGLYAHIAPGESMVAGGAWRPEPKDLNRIRAALLKDPKGWRGVLAGGVKLEGESLKRGPPGVDPNHPLIADLRRKDFVRSIPLADRDVAGPKFREKFLAAARTLDPLNRYLAKAVGLPW